MYVKHILNFNRFGKNLNMNTIFYVVMILISLIVYCLTFIAILFFKRKKRITFSTFPKMMLKKDGVYFFSQDFHRLPLMAQKVVLVGKNLYVKQDEKVVIITNVDDVKLVNNFLYFKCLGKVKILFDCVDFYRYFAIRIESKYFDFSSLKQMAIRDVLNNGFSLKNSKTAKKFIKIIENVLKISIFKEKIVVGQNDLRISYVLIYKLNRVIKRVSVVETF